MTKKPTYVELEKKIKTLKQEYHDYMRTTESLRESHERFKALFDRNLHCIYVHDFEGNFLEANAASLNLLGYKKENISSVNFAALIGEDQLPKALEAIEQSLLNLYFNAAEAMPNGGNLYIETENVTLRKYVLEKADFKPGKYVKISIADVGLGIDEKDLRAFFYHQKIWRRKRIRIGFCLRDCL